MPSNTVLITVHGSLALARRVRDDLVDSHNVNGIVISTATGRPPIISIPIDQVDPQVADDLDLLDEKLFTVIGVRV